MDCSNTHGYLSYTGTWYLVYRRRGKQQQRQQQQQQKQQQESEHQRYISRNSSHLKRHERLHLIKIVLKSHTTPTAATRAAQ